MSRTFIHGPPSKDNAQERLKDMSLQQKLQMKRKEILEAAERNGA